jgi:predicted MFS family arabinose efflux permease
VEGVAPQERGSVIGTTSAFLDLAFGLGPAVLGVVAASIGRPGTFLAGAGVAAAGLLLVVWTRLGHSGGIQPRRSPNPQVTVPRTR